jgi:hypothetical protein
MSFSRPPHYVENRDPPTPIDFDFKAVSSVMAGGIGKDRKRAMPGTTIV